MNNLISNLSDQNAYQQRIDAAFRYIRRQYTQRAWPTVAHIVKAMEQTVPKEKPISTTGKTMNPAAINAARIRSGQPVGDSWLWGKLSHELIKTGEVTNADLDRYRNTAFEEYSRINGITAANRWLANMEARHNGS